VGRWIVTIVRYIGEMRPKTHLAAIDGLRAVAVLAVMADHAFAFAPGGAWLRGGARGVDLFFAISGFCLAYPFLATFRHGADLRIPYAAFVVRRIVRVAPPYFVALTAFAALAFTHFGLPTVPGLERPPVGALVAEFARDGAFLTGASPSFNSSFWTLGIEMRWYLLFPLVLGLYARSRVAFFALAGACYWIYFRTPVGFADLGTLPCFMAGIVAADLRLRDHALERIAGRVAPLALAVACWFQLREGGVDHGEPIWHVAAFCLVAATQSARVSRALAWGPIAFVGRASYSIYLVHLPILDALEDGGMAPLASTIVAGAIGIAFFLAVERPLLDRNLRARLEHEILRFARALVPREVGSATITARSSPAVATTSS
jgi:peptidoglycan/LPS O-acetylase OafA/YrhL